jgi:hypothetical protein
VKLTLADLALLAALGIGEDLVRRAGIHRVDDREGRDLLGIRDGKAGDYSGVFFPYVSPRTGQRLTGRLRLDVVQTDGGNERKYLAPYGDPRSLYYPPGITTEDLADTSLELDFVEAEKSALSGTGVFNRAGRRGLFIALGGCWNFRGRIGKTENANGARVDEKGLLPDFHKIAWKGRVVTILYDARPNDSVRAARRELAKELRKLGAVVKDAHLPDDDPRVNGPDDYVHYHGDAALLEVLDRAVEDGGERSGFVRELHKTFDGYMLLAAKGLTVFATEIRKERHHTYVHLDVQCEWPEARTFEGSLSAAEQNISSRRERTSPSVVGFLKDRGGRPEFDWAGLMEELSIRILHEERKTTSEIVLDDAPDLPKDVNFEVDGIILPADGHTILYADGGSMKSYLAIYISGKLVESGRPVLYCDFEWNPARHRARKVKIFGSKRLDDLTYLRCYAPLAQEIGRIRRIVHERKIGCVIIDSIVPALDGKAADDDVTTRYMNAANSLPACISLAHITKNQAIGGSWSGESELSGAFGSRFFHDLCRQSYKLKRTDDDESGIATIGVYQDKHQETQKLKPFALDFDFRTPGRIFVRPGDLMAHDDLRPGARLADRIRATLTSGPKTYVEIAKEMGGKTQPTTVSKTIEREIRRGSGLFEVDTTQKIHQIRLVKGESTK